MESKEVIAELPFVKRDKVIIRTSIVGIAANVMLAGFKAAVGLAANSIAVVLDAVNNLSDALSSIITIIGTKLAGKQPDKKHPLGYGRIEYLSAMLVAGIVLYAGITSVVESVKKMLHPEKPEYGVLSLVIIAVGVIVKVALGRYVKAQGEKVNSGSLVASGSDAMFDAILSFSVLICAIVFMTTGISFEAYIGAVISCFIIKAGVEMMADTINDLLGRRTDKKTADKVRRILEEEPLVRGAHDLFLYNFGPDRNYASVHLELPDTMTVEEVDRLTRKVEPKVFSETGVILTGVGVYSQNTGDDETAKIQEEVRSKVMTHGWALGFHGFHLDEKAGEMRFDVVMSFDIMPRKGVEILQEEIGQLYPNYDILIVPDVDISD